MSKYRCDKCGYYVYRFACQSPYILCPFCIDRMKKISPTKVDSDDKVGL